MIDFDSTESALVELCQARQDYLAATSTFEAARKRLEATGVTADDDTDPHSFLTPFLRWLQRQAERECHVAGGNVSLDEVAFEARLTEACGFSRPSSRYQPGRSTFALVSAALLDGSLSLKDCWDSMLAVLRSDDIVSGALAEMARNLSYAFGKSLVGKVRRTSGKICVRHYVSMCSIWPDRLNYHSVENYQQAVSGLIAVADWAELDGIGSALRASGQVIDNHRAIESRAQYNLGGGVVLVTFKSSFEYRLPESLGVALGQFVNRYASETLERYAA